MLKYNNFENISRDFMPFEKVYNLINNDSSEGLFHLMWNNTNEVEKVMPEMLRCSSFEEFVSKWGERLHSAMMFIKRSNLLENNIAHLYRSVILGPEDVEPNIEDVGTSWTTTREQAELFGNNILGEDDDPNFAVCILEADIDIKDIDFFGSLLLNAIEPEEKEIRLYDDAKPLNIEYEVI